MKNTLKLVFVVWLYVRKMLKRKENKRENKELVRGLCKRDQESKRKLFSFHFEVL